MIEGSLAKEIPETTQSVRTANMIPINHVVDKNKIRKEYRELLKRNGDCSSDSEYEQRNLQKMLTKKRNKGAASLDVLKRVEQRLA